MSYALKSINREKTRVHFEDESLTQQHHTETVDIHNILKKYKQTGVIQHVAQYKGSYGDFASAPDFQTAQNIIAQADSMFETVPAHIRADFDNDPAKFLEFMQNNENIEAIEEYGFDSSHLDPPSVDEPSDIDNIPPEASPEPVDPPSE